MRDLTGSTHFLRGQQDLMFSKQMNLERHDAVVVKRERIK